MTDPARFTPFGEEYLAGHVHRLIEQKRKRRLEQHHSTAVGVGNQTGEGTH